MNKKALLIACLSAALCGSAMARLNVDAPPSIDSAPDNVQRPEASGTTLEERITEINMKNPDEPPPSKEQLDAESQQAQKDLDKAKVRGTNPSSWPKTKIEETVNNKNEVTEVKVTPMSTQIPYVMTREQRTNSTNTGADGRNNTMSIPKFLNFGF